MACENDDTEPFDVSECDTMEPSVKDELPAVKAAEPENVESNHQIDLDIVEQPSQELRQDDTSEISADSKVTVDCVDVPAPDSSTTVVSAPVRSIVEVPIRENKQSVAKKPEVELDSWNARPLTATIPLSLGSLTRKSIRCSFDILT